MFQIIDIFILYIFIKIQTSDDILFQYESRHFNNSYRPELFEFKTGNAQLPVSGLQYVKVQTAPSVITNHHEQSRIIIPNFHQSEPEEDFDQSEVEEEDIDGFVEDFLSDFNEDFFDFFLNELIEEALHESYDNYLLDMIAQDHNLEFNH